MTKLFLELTDSLPKARRDRIDAKKVVLRSEMDLAELRNDLALTQVALARAIGVGQAEVSKLEKRADMLISTLRKMIEAMGGTLEIRAVFKDRTIAIRDLASLSIPKISAPE